MLNDERDILKNIQEVKSEIERRLSHPEEIQEQQPLLIVDEPCTIITGRQGKHGEEKVYGN